jgi:hypothetical protein
MFNFKNIQKLDDMFHKMRDFPERNLNSDINSITINKGSNENSKTKRLSGKILKDDKLNSKSKKKNNKRNKKINNDNKYGSLDNFVKK